MAAAASACTRGKGARAKNAAVYSSNCSRGAHVENAAAAVSASTSEEFVQRMWRQWHLRAPEVEEHV